MSKLNKIIYFFFITLLAVQPVQPARKKYQRIRKVLNFFGVREQKGVRKNMQRWWEASSHSRQKYSLNAPSTRSYIYDAAIRLERELGVGESHPPSAEELRKKIFRTIAHTRKTFTRFHNVTLYSTKNRI